MTKRKRLRARIAELEQENRLLRQRINEMREFNYWAQIPWKKWETVTSPPQWYKPTGSTTIKLPTKGIEVAK